MFSRDLGIDLGTATTLVYAKGQGILFAERSAIAIQAGTRNVVAVGDAAGEMLGRTPPAVAASEPVQGGVIADFDLARLMLSHFVRRASRFGRLSRPRVVIGVPSGITDVERRAVVDAATQAGCREVLLIEEPVAAAIGCGLPIASPRGQMIVDIGGGTTDIAVLALGGIVSGTSVKVAGMAMDEAIIQHARRRHNLQLGRRVAERAKIEAGSALPGRDRDVLVCGMDVRTRLPRCQVLTSEELREALSEPCRQIVHAVRAVIERCPPELLSDIARSHIVMTGGGSLLPGLAELIARETTLPVRVAENALTAVASGTGKALEQVCGSRPFFRLRRA